MFVYEKLRHFAVTFWISIRTNWIQRSTQKNAGQEEDLNQKYPSVIDRFVFNNLAVDKAGQTADNKHTGNMIFPFFLLVSKTDKPLGDDTFQNQSVKLICWQAFSFIRFFYCFFLFSFQAEIDAF